jgi:5'(3')-deoxyribonucleotidase
MNNYNYKPIVGGVDMDQVLTSWDNPDGIFARKVKEITGNFIPISQWKNWLAHLNYPKDLADAVENIYANPEPGFFYELEPIPGAIEAVKRLQDKMEIITVSTPVFEMDGHMMSISDFEKRDRLWCQVVEEKKLWLRKYFGIHAPMFNPLSDKTIFHGDFLIDDKPTAGREKRRVPSWIHVLYDDNYLYNKGSRHKYRLNWNNYKPVMESLIREIESRK